MLAKRINNAKELLRYSNSSIEEIAHLCGIDDASYFNKVFRKMEGLSLIHIYRHIHSTH